LISHSPNHGENDYSVDQMNVKEAREVLQSLVEDMSDEEVESLINQTKRVANLIIDYTLTIKN